MADLTVIMAAYGPDSTTQAAISRMKRLLRGNDRLIVYPGTVATQLPRESSPARVVTKFGRDGLGTALVLCDEHAFVVHITDTVVLDLASLQALAAAHRRTGQLVVPWTNDIGTDHSLRGRFNLTDPDRTVRESRPKTPATSTARLVRPGCIGGSRSQITALMPFHLTYPLTTLRLVADEAIVPRGAVAMHIAPPYAALLPPHGPDGRPLLVASMIVRDEEDMLEGCLQSLAGIVDRVDLCDTGSIDATLDIAKRYGCNIIERPWRDDFGWARNEALKLGQDAWWAIWIDADERLHVPDVNDFRRQLATAIGHFSAIRITISGPDFIDSDDSWLHARLFRPDLCEFSGKLHERVVLRGTQTLPTPSSLDTVRLEHLGYTNELVIGRDKAERNLRIARQAVEDDPDDPVAALHYARSLSLAGVELDTQLDYYRQVDERFDESTPPMPIRAQVKALRAMTMVKAEQHRDAIRIAADALDLVPADAGALEVFVSAALLLDEKDAALQRYEDSLSLPSLQPMMDNPSARDRAGSVIVAIHLERGELDQALRVTERTLTETGGYHFGSWNILIPVMMATLGDDFAPHMVDLMSVDRGAGWIPAVVKTAGGELALQLVAAHLRTGMAGAEAVRVGLTLAMIRGDYEQFVTIAAHADVLPDEDIRALVSRLKERGDHRMADHLAGTREQ